MSFSHHFRPHTLRAYDIRGVVGETLGTADAYAVGRTVAALVRKRHGRSMALGWDGRTSSPELAAQVSRGIRDSGIEVRHVGLGPTPMLYYACHKLGVDGGIQVTGSHNPGDHNGFKIVIENVALSGDAIQELGRLAARGVTAQGNGAAVEVRMAPGYVGRLCRDIELKPSLKCVWDPGNGAVCKVLDDVLLRLPGTHTVLNGVVDGSFPAHHPDPCDPANLCQLQDAVRAQGAHMGLAFDGDGDRLGVVDSKGRIVAPDQYLILLARAVLERHPGSPIVADVKSSEGLFKEIRRSGGRPDMWRTGHSLIKARMRDLKAPLAGEMSGHVFFSVQWYGFDDAIYAGLRLLHELARTGTDLAGFVDQLPPLTATPELRLDCSDETKFGLVEAVRERLRDSGVRFNDVDGVRVSSGDGWWLLRASNTEPALVARIEAQGEEALMRLKSELTGELLAAGIAVDSLSALEEAPRQAAG